MAWVDDGFRNSFCTSHSIFSRLMCWKAGLTGGLPPKEAAFRSTPIKRLLAEGFGTAILVFVGCGSVAIGSYGLAAPVGALPIALAFGLTVTALIYAVGSISGCHINPAVTLALWAAKRFQSSEVIGYVAAQLAGRTALPARVS